MREGKGGADRLRGKGERARERSAGSGGMSAKMERA